ncbi:MAG: N-acetylneuraminate synthase family protein [Desulfuromonadales bacterium]
MLTKHIAEIGCNHMGKMDIAHEMIKVAAQFCKVNVIKFQKRTNRELLTPEEYHAPHPNPANSYGPTYGEHREFLEFDIEQHRQLKSWCEEWGAEYSTSVWDLTAAREIATLEPKMLKIPSACNLDHGLLEWLIVNYPGEIHLSFGMTTHAEEVQIVSMFQKAGRHQDLVIYACTSGYPVPFADVCLYEIKRLAETFGGVVRGIGFSGHHLGIAVDVAALALGATYFERHFTLDRTLKGTDHAASLEPDGMRRLCRDLTNVSKAMTYKSEEILPIEAVQRAKLKRMVNG